MPICSYNSIEFNGSLAIKILRAFTILYFIVYPGLTSQILTDEDFAKIKELQLKKKLLPSVQFKNAIQVSFRIK
jgi:hypothetical protein